MVEAKVISVAHRKGGIGKTCITLHLATALSILKKKRVIVLDTDSQQSAFQYRAYEQEGIYENQVPPYPIWRVHPNELFETIRKLRSDYDIIFIDVPRITEANEDSQLTIALAYCDYVLIPIVAGDLEGLSTLDFIKLIQGVKTYKEQKGFAFAYHGFLNKKNQRIENTQAVEFMKQRKVPMFKSSLSDVKALSKPFTYESVLEGKEGQRRFEPFFKEFCKKFGIK